MAGWGSLKWYLPGDSVGTAMGFFGVAPGRGSFGIAIFFEEVVPATGPFKWYLLAVFVTCGAARFA